MQENFIYPGEALLLAIWFSLPALIIGIIVQALLFQRRHVRLLRAAAAFIVFSIGTVLLAMLLWVSLPAFLGAPSSFPSAGCIWFVPPFFLPSYLAGVIMLPLVARFVAKVQLAVQRDGPKSRPAR